MNFYSNGVLGSTSNVLTINPDSEIKLEFSFGGKPELQLILTDAVTNEHLDSCKVKKSSARDLSDLF